MFKVNKMSRRACSVPPGCGNHCVLIRYPRWQLEIPTHPPVSLDLAGEHFLIVLFTRAKRLSGPSV